MMFQYQAQLTQFCSINNTNKDKIKSSIMNKIQFNITQIVTSFSVNKNQDLIIVGFSDGQLLQYNLVSQEFYFYNTTSKDSKNASIIVIQIFQISDIQYAVYAVSSNALLLQIDIMSKKMTQSIDLRTLVNQDPNITLSKFLIDQDNQRYLFCFNGQKKAYVWNYSKNQLELNTKIEYVALVKKDFLKDTIIDIKLFIDNVIGILLIDRFELLIVNGDKFNMIAQISYQYPRILNYRFEKNILQILGLHKTGVFENSYNLEIYKPESKSECSFLISIQEQQNLIEEQANVAIKQKEIQTINGISLINQENQLIYFYIQVPTTDIQNTFLQISQQKNSQYVIAPYDVDNNFIALSNDTFLTLGQQILQFTNFSLTFQNNTDLLINITQNKITQQIIFQNMDIDFACFGTNQIYISGIEKVIFQNIKISQLNLKECSQQDHFKVELNKFLQQQIMNIQSSKVQFNNFTQVQNEGSLLLTKSQEIIIEKGHFKLNTAQNGGAIYFLAIQTKIQFKESFFQQNTANSSGGALYLENIDNCIIQFDTVTMIKNNKALIGGGLRIVQTNQKKLLLPQNFPFSNNIFENKAEIYGDDSTSYLQNIIIKSNDSTNEELFTFYQNQSSVPKKFQNDYSRYAELRQFRSGGLINFKMYIVDEQNRYLSFSNEKLTLGLYPNDIDQELNTIQISIYQLNSTESQMFGQNTINYFQYNSLDYSFEMNEITVIGNLNKVQFFYINSTIQTNSLTKQPILLSIEFRNCKLGEVIQQVNNNIFQCNQCLKGTYQLVDPQTLYQQSIQQNKDINKCINCPQSALMCKGDIIELKNGFWRHNNYTDEIIECDPIINSCQAENPNSINYCKAGYLGPICLQCDILGEV
ncbi:transmembrane protein, putative, partial (macronuclear) [Tetrahymena thermophila SB210]